MLFLHKLWPTVLDKVIAYIVIKKLSLYCHQNTFCSVAAKGQLYAKAQPINQLAPCCVLALMMIKISPQLRLTSDSLRVFFGTGLEASRNENPHCLPSGGVHDMYSQRISREKLYQKFSDNIMNIQPIFLRVWVEKKRHRCHGPTEAISQPQA